jgi:hypothetical protein
MIEIWRANPADAVATALLRRLTFPNRFGCLFHLMTRDVT